MTASPFEKFNVVLDKASGIFQGGDRMTGHVLVVLNRQMTLRAVKLQIKGKAQCSKLEGLKKENSTDRTYCDRDLVLLERPPGRNHPGHFPWTEGHSYELPFESPLPRGCPTSYEGPQGHVRYYCRVLVIEDIEGGKERTYYMKRLFTVLAPPPLSVPKTLLQPIAVESQASTGSCCCRGRVGAEVRLPKSIYVSGETIYGTIDVNNKQARAAIQQMHVRLVEKIVHHDDPSVKSFVGRVICEQPLDKSAISRSESFHRDNFPLLTIPAIAPSALRSTVLSTSDTTQTIISSTGQVLTNYATLTKHPNPLFNLAYELDLHVGPKLIVSLPITIGSIPLSLDDQTPQPTSFKNFSLGPQHVSEPEEAGWQKVGNQFDNYAPVYAVFEQGLDHRKSTGQLSSAMKNGGGSQTISPVASEHVLVAHA